MKHIISFLIFSFTNNFIIYIYIYYLYNNIIEFNNYNIKK